MTDEFFVQPILNSPYEHPGAHWELDEEGQLTIKRIASRLPSRLIVPVPRCKHRRLAEEREPHMMLGADPGLSAAYWECNSIQSINAIRYPEAMAIWLTEAAPKRGRGEAREASRSKPRRIRPKTSLRERAVEPVRLGARMSSESP